MTDCRKCKRIDVKCCPTCKRSESNCGVWHKCGEDCVGYEARIVTNADRIRNMSDEELAEFLLSDDFYTDCDNCKEPETEHGDCIGRCENELLRWLHKEVE